MIKPPFSSDAVDDNEQTWIAHLVELRDRIIHALLGWLFVIILLAIWPGAAHLLDILSQPIQAHLPAGTRLIAIGVFSPFFVPLKVLVMVSFLLALPWIMYQVWRFIAPGLYQHEKRFALPVIILGCVLAYMGIAFVQWVVLDKMFALIQQVTPVNVAATPDIAFYVEAVVSLYIAFALAFQVPVVVIMLVKFNWITLAQLKAFRSYFIVLSFVVAAVVTPPDVISQIALAVPMCLLYEAGIWASRWWIKPSEKNRDTPLDEASQ